MLITVSFEDKLFSFEVEVSETIENVKALLEVETGIPIAQQTLVYSSRRLSDASTLGSAGIKDSDVLQLLPAPPPPAGGSQGMTQLLEGLLRPRTQADIYTTEAKRLRESVASDRNILPSLRLQDPELADAIEAVNPHLLVDLIRRRHQKKLEVQRAQQMAAMDPLNPEGQKAIEEALLRERVNENYEKAQEYYPEFFGNITMLYVEMEVNKKPIQAFVDSGAQSTIMSEELAERLGLMKLCDKRYAGVAQGVGTSKILGRIHATEVMIGGKYFACSLTILEDNKVDFLFGLDNLKRHQCCIDLVNNRLVLDNASVSVPFLSESQIIPNKLFASHLLKQGEKKPEEKKKEEAAPAPRAAAPAPAPPKPAAGGAVHPREKVVKLIELGFSESQAIDALNKTAGNVELAGALLMNQF